MNNNCKKDFVDITYDLLCKNSMLNLVSPRNVIKQYFDKKNKTKKTKIDPLKEIKERREISSIYFNYKPLNNYFIIHSQISILL